MIRLPRVLRAGFASSSSDSTLAAFLARDLGAGFSSSSSSDSTLEAFLARDFRAGFSSSSSIVSTFADFLEAALPFLVSFSSAEPSVSNPLGVATSYDLIPSPFLSFFSAFSLSALTLASAFLRSAIFPK